jgi:hypothetical protein
MIKQKTRKKKKLKEIKLQMKFNPGTLKYEPVIPVKKTGEKISSKLKIKWILIIILIMILAGIIIFLLEYLNSIAYL